MSDRRVFRWATTSARLLAGTLVAAAFVVGVVTAVSVPWPTVAREPVAVEATPAPSASVLVCDGGPPGPRSRTRGRRTHRRPPRRRPSRAASRRAHPIRPTQPLASPAADGTAPPTSVVAQPNDGARTDVAASGLRHGLGRGPRAVSPPRRAARRSWSPGSSADPPRPAQRTSCCSPIPALFRRRCSSRSSARRAPQVPAGGSELVVAPGAQIVVPLAGLVLGEESPVIRVTAIGAPVQAVAAGEHHPHAAPGRRRPGRRDRRARSRCR